MSYISKQLISWHKNYGRHNLPWQQTRDPYAIWVSEIMLQQTQVTTVIKYYQKFMDNFPTVSALAEADEEKVMKLWAGLGYYARARNLYKSATIVSNEYKGVLPSSMENLIALPGIGRSTAGAICAFSFGQLGVFVITKIVWLLACFFADPNTIISGPEKMWLYCNYIHCIYF